MDIISSFSFDCFADDVDADKKSFLRLTEIFSTVLEMITFWLELALVLLLLLQTCTKCYRQEMLNQLFYEAYYYWIKI